MVHFNTPTGVDILCTLRIKEKGGDYIKTLPIDIHTYEITEVQLTHRYATLQYSNSTPVTYLQMAKQRGRGDICASIRQIHSPHDSCALGLLVKIITYHFYQSYY